MQFNRDELLLLSRAGRVPPSARPRPDPPPVVPAHRPAIGSPLGARVAALCSGVRGRRGRRTERGSASASATYLELEFLVGFGVDDEPGA